MLRTVQPDATPGEDPEPMIGATRKPLTSGPQPMPPPLPADWLRTQNATAVAGASEDR